MSGTWRERKAAAQLGSTTARVKVESGGRQAARTGLTGANGTGGQLADIGSSTAAGGRAEGVSAPAEAELMSAAAVCRTGAAVPAA